MVQHLNAPISLESLNITCRAIFEQLDQVNARITASEELRTASEKLRIASEERIAASTVMSEKLRIASEERIAATAEQITASTARFVYFVFVPKLKSKCLYSLGLMRLISA